MTVNTTPAVSGEFTGNVASGTADIIRAVSLEDLKSQAGCSGFTTGRLRILNNELPKPVSGVPYTVNVYADGGVGSYTWTAVTPPWLTFSPCTPPDATCQNLYDLPPDSGSFPVTVTIRVTDTPPPPTPGNTAERTYTIPIP